MNKFSRPKRYVGETDWIFNRQIMSLTSILSTVTKKNGICLRSIDEFGLWQTTKAKRWHDSIAHKDYIFILMIVYLIMTYLWPFFYTKFWCWFISVSQCDIRTHFDGNAMIYDLLPTKTILCNTWIISVTAWTSKPDLICVWYNLMWSQASAQKNKLHAFLPK